MTSAFTDPRKAIVGVTLTNGSEHIVLSFPTGKPTYNTLQTILSALVDGYTLAKAETAPIHELKP